MSDGPSDGKEAISQLATINGKLKSEGFSTVAELVTAYQTVSAERDKAVEARDKFSTNNDEAQVIIRTKAGEIGTLKAEVEQLKAQVEAGDKGAAAGTDDPPAGTPKVPVKPVEKTVAEKLAEVEAGIPEELWTQADALLAVMSDEDAERYTSDPQTRLEFLEGLRDDPANKKAARPKSFRKPKEVGAPSPQGEDAYSQLKKKLGIVVPGPGGPSRSVAGSPVATAKREPDWLKN